MNKPVSFELAKLLKDRGYKDKNAAGTVRLSEPTYYDDKGIIHDFGDFWEQDKLQDCYNAPTIANVVMWLYEKHDVWIEVRHIKTFNVNRFHVIIWDYKDTSDYMTIHCDNGVGYEVWDSPTEAYEAGIFYTLNNLK